MTLKKICHLVLVVCSLTGVARAENAEIVLFDGKDTNGWTQAGPGSFELKDGELHTKDGMGLLWNERELGDFKLTLEFKTSRKEDNSGIFVRFPDPKNDPWVAVKEGYEIQICDTQEGHHTGAIYDVQDSKEVASKPVGEWNEYEITCVGQKFTIKLNGKVVNEFEAKKGLKGHVGLQNHDPTSHVSFRNIKVTELGDAPKQAAIPQVEVKEAVPGLVAEYFKDITELGAVAKAEKPFLVRVDKDINFKNVDGNFYKTKLALNFGARWNGILRIEQPGDYSFELMSDDGSRLYIGDKLLINNEKMELNDKPSQKVTLAKGAYAIRVEYHQGPGGASCFVKWTKPEGKTVSVIPAAALFHEAGSENIPFDKEGFAKAVFDSKGWKQAAGKKSDKMDYGPFLSATLDAGSDNTTNKGIAIKLNKPSDKEEQSVIFDTELLRYSAGWTGGYLNYTGVAFDGAHGPCPTAEGDLLFVTHPEPGAKLGDKPEKQFEDPRPKPFGPMPREWGHYKGLYLSGDRVVLSYTVGDCEVLDSPGFEKDGDTALFTRTIQLSPSSKPLTILACDDREMNAAPAPKEGETPPPAPKHMPLGVVCSDGITASGHSTENGRIYLTFPPRTEKTTYKFAVYRSNDAFTQKLSAKEDLEALCKGGAEHWKQTVETKGTLGTGDGPYVVDTITEPETNPYNSWLRFGGLDFFSDGRAALTTWSGDVWICSGIDDKLEKLTWKRYATGLFQPLGLRIVDDKIYTLGRDQITRLHDLNGDGEADFYENFNNDCQVSSSFHEFSFDLQTDTEGNFYYAKAGPVRPGGRGWQTITDHNGCVLKVSKDGSKFEVFATGVRAPNGMSTGPNGEITVADNEGTWTPACRLSIVKQGMFLGVTDLSRRDPLPTKYDLPVCWFPHGNVDNSSGGQIWVTSDNWGPFKGELLHMSYGKCSLFHVMMETVDGQVQGGVVKFPLKFDTGICRARWGPKDGQLYVAGLRGWQTDAVKDAALQRVRYTGKPVEMPNALHVNDQGVQIGFTAPIDPKAAVDLQNYAVEQWNYLWSKEYGSPEFSVETPGTEGHDTLDVSKVTVAPDGKSIFLSIADLKPVMQMKIQMKLKTADGKPLDYDIYNTINRVAKSNTVGVKAPTSQAAAGQN